MALFIAKDYRPIAKANEEVFRNILRDIKKNSSERFFGKIVPEDLQTELPIDELYELYSAGDREGKFTIKHCTIAEGQIWFAFEQEWNRREKGAQLHYNIVGTEVHYTGPAVIPIGFDDDD